MIGKFLDQAQSEFIALGLSLLVLNACSSIPTAEFIPGKRLDVEGDFFTHGAVKQNGKHVENGSLVAGLQANASSSESIKSAVMWKYISVVPAAVGGALIGNGLAAPDLSQGDRNTRYLIGGGLILVALIPGYISAKAYIRAFEEYNGSLRKSNNDLQPLFGLTQLQGSSDLAPYMGLAWVF